MHFLHRYKSTRRQIVSRLFFNNGRRNHRWHHFRKPSFALRNWHEWILNENFAAVFDHRHFVNVKNNGNEKQIRISSFAQIWQFCYDK